MSPADAANAALDLALKQAANRRRLAESQGRKIRDQEGDYPVDNGNYEWLGAARSARRSSGAEQCCGVAPRRISGGRPTSRRFKSGSHSLRCQRDSRHQEGRRSFVYFVTCENEDFPIKIGTAGDVDTRLKSIQTGLPWPIQKLLIIKGGEGKERELHELFAEHRLHGEWFIRCDAILKYIAERSI